MNLRGTISLYGGRERSRGTPNCPSVAAEEPIWKRKRNRLADSGFDLEKLGNVAELVIAGGDQLRRPASSSARRMFLQADIQQIRCGFVIRCAPPSGSGTMSSMHPSSLKIGGSNAHGFRGQFFLGRIAPHDGGAAFWRDHRINGVLHHQNAIGHRNRQCPAAAAHSDHRSDDRNFEAAPSRADCRRSPRPARAPRRECRDRRRRYRPK